MGASGESNLLTCEDKVPVHRYERIGEAKLLRVDWIVDLAEVSHQAFFHAENRVCVQIRTVWREDMGRNRLKTVRANDKVDMGGPVGVTAERLQELAPARRSELGNGAA